eukprot:TRINITY_DN1259_c0_g1_i4.p1 TRINITY_DN1259_c0_g1~~TRINITY_DN1259_c0_g1_i4.p1  ORF type:complete len:291 (+),score=29.80 TRINITY_DN1259_c0_g1_i4:83-955(+)
MGSSCCTIFSKYWIALLSIILLLGAIGIIVFSFCFFNFDEVLPAEGSTDMNKIFTWIVVGLGGILIELSILGILLVWSKNKCISFLYSVQIILMFFIFVGLTIAMYVGFEKVNDEITCKNLHILEDADKLFMDGSKLLCSNYCRCEATRDWLQDYLEENDMNWSKTSGVVRVQDCKNYADHLGGTYDNLIKSLKLVEEKFKCSGICTMPEFYLYSDINSNSKPQKACLNSIKDEIKDISSTVSMVFAIIGLILLITLICNFVVCCQGKKKKKKNDEGDKYIVQDLSLIHI